MILSKRVEVGFFDIAHDRRLKLEAAARFFQDVAIQHSIEAGAGPDHLFSIGKVWLLHRLEIRVNRYPLLGERLEISTWSRGFRQYMGLREYTIASDRGIDMEGASVWVFVDIEKKRVVRMPKEMAEGYGAEEKTRFRDELYKWQPLSISAPGVERDISLRYGDFDLNGHVNNTIYPGFVETLSQGCIPPGSPNRIGALKLRYGKEIPMGQEQIRICCGRSEDRYIYALRGRAGTGDCFAEGEFSFMEDPVPPLED